MAAEQGPVESCEDAWPDGAPALAVVVFSKDRPYQLANCLSTALRHIRGARLLVTVLHKASTDEFRDSYTVVQRFFAKGAELGLSGGAVIRWEEESDKRPLGTLLDEAADSAETAGARGLLFTVDDALWFDDFWADVAIGMLCSEPDVYAVHAKLCPRIEYAHPNDKFMKVPQLRAFMGASEAADNAAALETHLLTYDRSSGEYDWNYPWELSASVYRLDDVRDALRAVREHFGGDAADHPNKLEGYGVRLFKQEKLLGAKRTKRCACVSKPVVAVVTINRVQTLFDNPVYGQEGTSQASPEASPEQLDRALRAEVCRAAAVYSQRAVEVTGTASDGEADTQAMANYLGLPAAWLARYLTSAAGEGDEVVLGLEDGGGNAVGAALACAPIAPMLPVDAYRSAYLDSVHVPLLPRPRSAMPPDAVEVPLGAPRPGPLVSWLLPVHDAPAEWLAEAWESIRQQRGMGPGSWELVVADDCSGNAATLQVLSEWEALPQVRMIRLPQRLGVAGALNAGWCECRGDFVARLDADDVAHPERLRRQLAYFEAHPGLSIVGGGFRTFQTSEDLRSRTASAGARRYRMPCHPLLARWGMLFSCSLAHPTVTFRRADFPSDPGPYPQGEEAEDHCCWLALPLRVQYANIADVVTYLRRHPGSRSASAAAAIKRSSFAGVRRFIAEHCAGRLGATADAVTDDDVAVLWGAQNAATAEQAQRVSGVLDALEALFLGLVEGEGALSPEFVSDFVRPRRAALIEYIKSSCGKLRGMVAVQSLAAGDLSGGTEMMRLWLRDGGGGGGLKSLGALIGAGFPGGGGQGGAQ